MIFFILGKLLAAASTDRTIRVYITASFNLPTQKYKLINNVDIDIFVSQQILIMLKQWIFLKIIDFWYVH